MSQSVYYVKTLHVLVIIIIISISISISISEVRLSPLGTMATTVWPILPAQDDR
jgi:hypothetical protein